MYRLILVGVLVSTFGCAPRKPTVERTDGQYRSATRDYLKAHILELHPASAKVSFVTDGQLGIYQEGHKWTQTFTLGTGEKFESQPDHHASSYFEIKQVNGGSVLLKYTSSFDHQSFGKNLLT